MNDKDNKELRGDFAKSPEPLLQLLIRSYEVPEIFRAISNHYLPPHYWEYVDPRTLKDFENVVRKMQQEAARLRAFAAKIALT